MKKEIFKQLYDNRLMRTEEEIDKFEDGLNELSETIQEMDILELCTVFDDNTEEDEVMFGVIHLIELFSSEKAFEYTVVGISNIIETALNWAKIIVYRCLNDVFSKNMLKVAINNADQRVQQAMQQLLYEIRTEDYDRFGLVIDDILEEQDLELE